MSAPEPKESPVQGIPDRIFGLPSTWGIAQDTQRAIEVYGLDNVQIEETSEVGVVKHLEKAISARKPIVVTGWTPHAKFARWNLRFLDDPENVFGGIDDLHAVVRSDLKETDEQLYHLVSNLSIELDDINRMMAVAEDELKGDLSRAAQIWVEDNRTIWEPWLPRKFANFQSNETSYNGKPLLVGGSQESSKTTNEVSIVHSGWPEGVFMSSLMKNIIESASDRSVQLEEASVSVIWQVVAEGYADMHLQAWLPGTMGDFRQQYSEKVEILDAYAKSVGRMGLVVPDYVEFESIEDLR